jgi:hypothetical protein
MKYKILSYTVANQNTKEICEYPTDSFSWEEARFSAIELANLWKEHSDLEDAYQGIQLWLTIGNDDQSEHKKIIHLLTGSRMNTPSIVQALWNEGDALIQMGYQFDKTMLTDDKGVSSIVNSQKMVNLYYFTI